MSTNAKSSRVTSLLPSSDKSDADRLGRLEALDVVAAETAVARDDALAEIEPAWRSASILASRALRLGERHQVAQVVEQHGIGTAPASESPVRRRAGRSGERRQIRRDVGHLRVGQPQIGHVGARVVVLRIADPVVEPDVRRLAADALQRLAERAPRTGGRAIVLVDDVAAQAADRSDDLLTRLRVAPRR